MNYAESNDILQILKGISKKTPQGIMQGDTTVGHITWQMYLMRDYLKLDGTPLANASVDYKELLKFAQDNNLTTTDTTDKSLFKYDATTDVLTLPDYIGLVLQGGNTVEEKEAGLPNITGETTTQAHTNTSIPLVYNPQGAFSHAATYNAMGMSLTGTAVMADGLSLDASRSSPIYGNSTTVQPPAITLMPQIKYKKSTTIWETVDIGKFVATAPAHYEREQLFSTNKTEVTIYPTWINIDGSGYVLNKQTTLNINETISWDDSQYATAANRAGKDFYIYACKPVSDYAPKFILSINSTVPTGYTANDSRKIGGFHCLCVDVGTISGHTLSGYIAGDILPNSPWDLDFRAESENNGMVYIPQIGLWADIYLGSWDGLQIVSEYNGTPITGTSSKPMHGLLFAENYGLVNKFLPSYDEFIVCAKGSPEGDRISTGSAPSGTGGHIATGGQRIISNYGLEDCVGVLWQWSRDCPEAMSTSYSNGSYWMNGYDWRTYPVYNPSIDTIQRGSCFGLLRRLIFGGSYGDAVSYCGSRAVDANLFGAYVGASVGGRGFSRKR